MHAFIIGSTFVITYLITTSCCRRILGKRGLDEDDYEMDDISLGDVYEKYPFTHFISKTKLLQYFAEDKNYERLKKILNISNGILEKTLKLIENNHKIGIHFDQTQDMYGEQYFHHTYDIATIFEIRDSKFKTSLGQLNYIRWLLENDYFLHIE